MDRAVEHFDVLIVGAGLSGVGAGVHLHENCPTKTYAILESRADMGGTWDLFRYPGVRSDSDMHTLGFMFKPWVAEKSIADGPAILDYVKEAAAECGVAKHIRFHHTVKTASWSAADSTWTVTAERGAGDEAVKFTCNFLYMCSGYYNYRQPFDAQFQGVDAFKGTVIHPQFWPENLDYSGKKVVVIGSGATAMTLVPAMAKDAGQVTMLQRSPTYVVSRPAADAIANRLRKVLPERLAYAITRWKNVTMQQVGFKQIRAKPDKIKAMLLGAVRKELGPDYDVETHFTPRYNPWDQRLCLVPDSDLFAAIRSGKADVVTDHIDRFDATGIKLKSGQHLDADIIVTATGLNLEILGGVAFDLDGAPVDFSQTWSYKGMMYSDVPNMASVFGYINASWTLRADLLSQFVCRLLNHMDQVHASEVAPRLRAKDKDMQALPWIQDFTAGYMQRGMHRFPKQGDRDPWTNPQNYGRDKKMFRTGALEDGVLAFTSPVAAALAERQPALHAAE